jgi:uncharacterized membrane protein
MENLGSQETKVVLHKSDWPKEILKVIIILCLLFFSYKKNPPKKEFLEKVIEENLRTSGVENEMLIKYSKSLGSEFGNEIIGPLIERNDFLLFSTFRLNYPIDNETNKEIKGFGLWNNVWLLKENKYIKFNNNWGSKLYIAITYYDGNNWISHGWWTVNNSESFKYELSEYLYDAVYVRAEAENNANEWGNEKFFCCINDKFQFNNKESCEYKKGFYKLKLVGDTTFQNFSH